MTEVLQMYTDGACSRNPGPGGWACVFLYNGKIKEIHGGNISTTNNRMELQAVIEGLAILKTATKIKVFADSEYVLNPLQKGWLKGWIKKGWKTSTGGEVKNRDLWERLLPLLQIHQIEWVKVKGHSNVEMNNRVDKLAVAARREVVRVNNSE